MKSTPVLIRTLPIVLTSYCLLLTLPAKAQDAGDAGSIDAATAEMTTDDASGGGNDMFPQGNANAANESDSIPAAEVEPETAPESAVAAPDGDTAAAGESGHNAHSTAKKHRKAQPVQASHKHGKHAHKVASEAPSTMHTTPVATTTATPTPAAGAIADAGAAAGATTAGKATAPGAATAGNAPEAGATRAGATSATATGANAPVAGATAVGSAAAAVVPTTSSAATGVPTSGSTTVAGAASDSAQQLAPVDKPSSHTGLWAAAVALLALAGAGLGLRLRGQKVRYDADESDVAHGFTRKASRIASSAPRRRKKAAEVLDEAKSQLNSFTSGF